MELRDNPTVSKQRQSNFRYFADQIGRPHGAEYRMDARGDITLVFKRNIDRQRFMLAGGDKLSMVQCEYRRRLRNGG